MFFIEIAKPNWMERLLVLFAQAIFGLFYLFMYIFFTRTAHRMIGYFEDEAVKSYTEYFFHYSEFILVICLPPSKDEDLSVLIIFSSIASSTYFPGIAKKFAQLCLLDISAVYSS